MHTDAFGMQNDSAPGFAFKSAFGSVYSFNRKGLNLNHSDGFEMQVEEEEGKEEEEEAPKILPMTKAEENHITERRMALEKRNKSLQLLEEKFQMELAQLTSQPLQMSENDLKDLAKRKAKYEESLEEVEKLQKSPVYILAKEGKNDLDETMRTKLSSIIDYRKLFSYTLQDNVDVYSGEYNDYFVFLLCLRSSKKPLYYVIIRKNVIK